MEEAAGKIVECSGLERARLRVLQNALDDELACVWVSFFDLVFPLLPHCGPEAPGVIKHIKMALT